MASLPKAYNFQDINFNEFIIQWFSSLGIEELKVLSASERSRITPKRIHGWANTARLEEKLVMLGKTGGEFFLVAGKTNGWRFSGTYKSIFKQYNKGEGEARQKIIDALVKDKFFVMASQQMMVASFYMHQNCQSDYYRLNRDFEKLYTLWEETKTKIGKNTEGKEMKRVAAGADLVIDFAFHIFKNQGLFANLGLFTHCDILVLLFLMKKNKRENNRVTFVSGDIIYEACNDGSYTPNGFGRRVMHLAKEGYLKKMPSENRPRYAIGDRGVLIVMEYVKKMAEQVKFDL